MARKAVVIRGVYIRGTAHPEGTVGTVGNTKEAGDAFVVSNQEFDELRASNYLDLHVAPIVEPVVEVKSEPRVDKGGK